MSLWQSQIHVPRNRECVRFREVPLMSAYDPMYGPAARCKRFSSSWRLAVLHQCIRPLIGAFAPGHHGYQRACVLITGQASIGPFGSPVFARAGKTEPPFVSSSRRPRLETVDRVTSSLAPHIAQLLCSSQGPFLRPGPQNVDRVARRGGQGRPSPFACARLRPCQTPPSPAPGSNGTDAVLVRPL